MHGQGFPPPSGRGRGGGDAGSLLPGVLPPNSVHARDALSTEIRHQHAVRTTTTTTTHPPTTTHHTPHTTHVHTTPHHSTLPSPPPLLPPPLLLHHHTHPPHPTPWSLVSSSHSSVSASLEEHRNSLHLVMTSGTCCVFGVPGSAVDSRARVSPRTFHQISHMFYMKMELRSWWLRVSWCQLLDVEFTRGDCPAPWHCRAHGTVWNRFWCKCPGLPRVALCCDAMPVHTVADVILDKFSVLTF